MNKYLVICFTAILLSCSIPLSSTPSTVSKKKVDWETVCIRAESKKLSVKNVSAQTGYPIITVAMSVCSQKYVLNCYKAGKCK